MLQTSVVEIMKKRALILLGLLLMLIILSCEGQKDAPLASPAVQQMIAEKNGDLIYLHDSREFYVFSPSLVEETIDVILSDIKQEGLDLTGISIEVGYAEHPGIMYRDGTPTLIMATVRNKLITIYPRYTQLNDNKAVIYRTLIHEIAYIVWNQMLDTKYHRKYQKWRHVQSEQKNWDDSVDEVFAEDFKTVYTPQKRIMEFQRDFGVDHINFLFGNETHFKKLEGEEQIIFREMLRKAVRKE